MGARIAYYCFVLPLSYLPLWFIYGISGIFYLLLISIFPYRKKVIDTNIHRSFPELSENEIRKLRKRFYKHFSDILAEGIKNLSISQKELERRFKVNNPELMDQLYAKNKSVLLVSGHFNNWEWLITSLNFMVPHQAMGIGMPLTSKFWDKKINQRRQRFGMKVVHAKNFKEQIALHKEIPLAILVLSDQSPGDSKKSYWMNFLNQETAVLFGTELMAHEYNFAVVNFRTEKIKRGHYLLHLDLITDNPKEMKWGEITEAHTKYLEKLIIANPEQWIWSHKRWKRDLPDNLEELKNQQEKKFNEKFNY